MSATVRTRSVAGKLRDNMRLVKKTAKVLNKIKTLAAVKRDMPSKKKRKNAKSAKKEAEKIAKTTIEYMETEAKVNAETKPESDSMSIEIKSAMAEVDDHVKIVGGPLNGISGTINYVLRLEGKPERYCLNRDEDDKGETFEVDSKNPTCQLVILENSADKHARVYAEIKALRDEMLAELRVKILELIAYKQLHAKNTEHRQALMNYDGKDKYSWSSELGRMFTEASGKVYEAEWKRRDIAGIDEPIPKDFFPYKEWLAKFETDHKQSLAKELVDRKKLVTEVLAKHPMLSEPGLFKILTASYRNISKYGELDSSEMSFFSTDFELKRGFFGLDAWKSEDFGQRNKNKDALGYIVPATLNPDCVLHWAMLISEGVNGPCMQPKLHRIIDCLKEHWGMERYKKLLILFMFLAHSIGLLSPQLYIYTDLQHLYNIKPCAGAINEFELSLIDLFPR